MCDEHKSLVDINIHMVEEKPSTVEIHSNSLHWVPYRPKRGCGDNMVCDDNMCIFCVHTALSLILSLHSLSLSASLSPHHFHNSHMVIRLRRNTEYIWLRCGVFIDPTEYLISSSHKIN